MMFLYPVQLGASGLSRFQLLWSPSTFSAHRRSLVMVNRRFISTKHRFYTCSSAAIATTTVIIDVFETFMIMHNYA